MKGLCHKTLTTEQSGPPYEPTETPQLVYPHYCRRDEEFGFKNTVLSILLSNCELIPWRFSSLGTNTV